MALDPDMVVVQDSPATALLDARNGFGRLAGVREVDLAAAKAAAVGVVPFP